MTLTFLFSFYKFHRIISDPLAALTLTACEVLINAY